MPSDRAKRLTLIACILGTAIVFMDGLIVNVALPAITRDLGGGLAGQQWVVNGYLLVLGSLILVGGSLGDVLGEKRVFALGVAGFGVTSLLCAAAPTMGFLIAGRALQGVAGALLVPSSLAVIVAVFPPDERGAAVGSWTAWGGIAAVAGPLVGGLLLGLGSWRWIFAINLPLVGACLLLIRIAVPATPARAERHVDWRGAVLCALGLGGVVFGLIEGQRLGWGSPAVIGPIVAGALLLAVFFVHERRSPDPMLPTILFRRPNFAAGNGETLAMYGGLSIFSFLLTLFLQEVAGWTALAAGLASLPVSVIMFTLSRRFGALADRYGPRAFMAAGPLVAAAGMLLLLRVGHSVNWVTDVLPGVFVFGCGLSLTVAPLTAAVLAGVGDGEAGIASAVNNAVARVAGLVAVAAIGAIVGGQLDVTGFHRGLVAAAVLMALGGVVGAVWIRNPRRVTIHAERCPGGQLVGGPEEVCEEQRPLPEVATAA